MPIESVVYSLRDFLGAIALIALLSVAYGSTIRWCDKPRLARALLGAAFGGAAILAMFNSFVVAPGVIMDMRNVPIMVAGAFLGPEGLLVALGMAMSVRLGLGGNGAPAGTLGILLSGLLGLVWARRIGSAPRGPRAILALTAMLPVHWVTVLLLPPALLWPIVTQILPLMAAQEMLAVLVVAALLEREQRQVQGERRLAVDADHDLLTGLLNRRGFEKEVGLLRDGKGGSLLLLDIDHFKRINDRHGHLGGDAVLRALHGRLEPLLEPGQILGRLGGEEIAVFLPGVRSHAARDLARRLSIAMRSKPFLLPDGGAVKVTVSIGGAWGSPATLDTLMARADAALYAAKHAGRDRCRFAAEGHSPAVGPGQKPQVSLLACQGCHLFVACSAEDLSNLAAGPLDLKLPA